MNQLRAKRDSMRDSRGGLFSYRDFKKPPISIYTIYYFLVFPVKILSPFPTRRPSERPPAPAARLFACYCTTHHPGTLTLTRLSMLNTSRLPKGRAQTWQRTPRPPPRPRWYAFPSLHRARAYANSNFQLLPITFVCTFLMSIIPPPPLPPSPSRLPLLLLFCRARAPSSQSCCLLCALLLAVAPISPPSNSFLSFCLSRAF